MELVNPVILFDGVCNYCNRTVNAIIRRDKKKIFRFTPLQSEKGKEILKEFNLPVDNFDSFLLLQYGTLYDRSTAALKLYSQLPWYWKWTQVFWIFPRFLRNGAYCIIAKNRYKWWGKKDKCMMPSADVADRFL